MAKKTAKQASKQAGKKKVTPDDNPIPNSEGTRWKKGQSGNPNGRPKKISTVLQIEGFNQFQIKQICSLVSGANLVELDRILNAPEATALELVIARTFKKAIATGDYRAIKDVIEMVAGKAMQQTEIEVKNAEDQVFKVLGQEIKF